MPRLDARHVFVGISALDGLLAAGAAAHTLAAAPVVGAVVATQAALTASCLCPRCPWLGSVITRVTTTRSEVALTFDDGPDETLTPRVLALLAAHDAKASFFCIGTRARAAPTLIRAVARAGHSIENHSWHHSLRFALFGSRRMAREIDDTQHLLADLSGRPPSCFRAPAGFRNPWLAPLLAERSLRYAAWSRRGFDTVDPSPARVARRLAPGLVPGAVLLLHDGHNARDPMGRPVLETVLPRLLKELQGRGLRAVDLPTLLADPDAPHPSSHEAAARPATPTPRVFR
ncbi:polysaccharide deacetylase family protein [Acidiferrobacter sp.]|uniref:polysaccharide deacetylase family protein n=1 Tax=Acidiferrobacter sp. TaxID=1872107 RepID=UPI0026082A6B|nr:polysaccharide deacetylase family protein [Acidiferrobacter sp.]